MKQIISKDGFASSEKFRDDCRTFVLSCIGDSLLNYDFVRKHFSIDDLVANFLKLNTFGAGTFADFDTAKTRYINKLAREYWISMREFSPTTMESSSTTVGERKTPPPLIKHWQDKYGPDSIIREYSAPGFTGWVVDNASEEAIAKAPVNDSSYKDEKDNRKIYVGWRVEFGDGSSETFKHKPHEQLKSIEWAYERQQAELLESTGTLRDEQKINDMIQENYASAINALVLLRTFNDNRK